MLLLTDTNINRTSSYSNIRKRDNGFKKKTKELKIDADTADIIDLRRKMRKGEWAKGRARSAGKKKDK
jgi:hypothetical protein